MNRTVCITLLICGILLVRPLYSIVDPHNSKIPTLNTGNALNTFSALVTSDTTDIDTIDITHGCYGCSALDEETYTINRKGTNYFFDGKKVDPHLIQELQESFTDFYESFIYEYTYEDIIVFDHVPYFTVVVTFSNGKILTLRTTSCYHCFIPWNIEYERKTYVQYNGKISTAFLRILMELDNDAWKSYERTARWGCYPAVVPEKYLNRGLSSDFPVSRDVVTPEEERGRSHVLWEINLRDYVIGKPVYENGKVVVITYTNLICFDAETVEKLWLVAFHDKKSLGIYFFHEIENLLVCDGLVYAAGPDSVVYCVDIETGNVVWSHEADTLNPSIKISEDSLLVIGRGIDCLNGVTGKRIWRVTENTHSEVIYGDKILYTLWKDDDYFGNVVISGHRPSLFCGL